MSVRRRPKRSGELDARDVLERLERESGPGAWVAHGRALEALVRADPERFARAVGARARAESAETGHTVEAGDVVVECAGVLAQRAWAASRACFARSASPAFIDGAGRLVGEEHAGMDPWVARLVRRHLPVAGRDVLDEAAGQGFEAWAVLCVLAQYVDATCDDVAVVCETQRAEVLGVVWDGYRERDDAGLE